ncbi:glycosyltransferase [Halobacterium sp. CBA1126]|uniref:glycosyltransferase n=1 Tax=Halobacterium sp. CBA1126 TaxID=2668074 RepID=UPI0012F93B1E|nr:glycosyltransferase [Halobacterium sp. CBA1126]MUV59833.1 glycosyltransferase [Halobacterium sp. CBA1126]
MTELDPDVSLFVSSLAGGGAHKMVVQIAKGLDDLGYTVDIVAVTKEGPFVDSIPEDVGIVDLNANRALTSVPKLTQYLAKNNPESLLATPVSVTIPAIWANILSRSDTKLVIRAPTVISKNDFYARPKTLNDQILSRLVDYYYPNVDHMVAISNTVKEDLINNIGLNRDMVTTIYNPVIDDGIIARSKEPCEHPFF